MARSPRVPTAVTIKVTPDELAMILHALAATAATFSTAALIVRGTEPASFAAMGERYTTFHARLKAAHTH